MLIDVRRGLSLGVPEDRATVCVPRPAPPPGTAFPTRRLLLRGVPVFDLALWCGTCPVLFEKVGEPTRDDLGVVDDLLRDGLAGVDGRVLQAYGEVLPRSTYTALLLEATPTLVAPGDPSDYFAHEQVATWGIEPLTGVPDDPGTPYYRTFEAPVDGGHLYEFVVPMVPPSWNSAAGFAAALARSTDQRTVPTAVAFSLLDVVAPATDGESDDYYLHWVLTHFLLDGHHKVQAAAAAGRPVRVLSILDEEASIGSSADVTRMLRARSAPRQARSST